MITINTVSPTKFSFNGINYFKNFTPVVSGNKISIVNTYESCIVLTSAPTIYSDYTVNGNTFTSVAQLQDALLPIIFSKSASGTSWGQITGNLPDQPDLQNALNAKEPSITGGTTSQYWRGDKSWQTLNKAAVGLGNVDNTSDADKPISTATQTALNLKANDDSVVKLTGNQTIAGEKTFTNATNFSANVNITGTIELAHYTGLDYSGTGRMIMWSKPTGLRFGNSLTQAAFINIASLTNSRTFTLPNSSGTFALTSDLHNAVTIGTANGLSLAGQVLSLGLASSGANGALSSTDWNSFNNKVSSQWVTSGSNIYYNGGNVGIGTASPSVALEVGIGSLSNSTLNQYLRVNSGTYNALSYSHLDLFNFGNNFGNALGWRLTSGTESAGVTVGRFLSFNTVVTDGSGNPSTATERMRITSGGNVGIGTTSPSKKLDINGTAQISGIVSMPGMPYYSSNATALAGGLTYGDLYYDDLSNVKIVVNLS